MWTPVSQINIAQKAWQCVATNHDGTVLIAAVYGADIWIKTPDTEGKWVDIIAKNPMNINTANQLWTCVASSFSGTTLFACSNNELWKSVNTGEDWTNITPMMTGKWTSIATDWTGTNIYASATNLTTDPSSTGGAIWYSTNGGTTWSNYDNINQNWQSVATNQDGSVAIACVKGGDLWIKYGNTWFSSGIPYQNWRQVAINAEGNFFVACVSGGDIWKSYGDGLWHYSNRIQNWRSITMDKLGQNIFACASGNDIWSSYDSGISWSKTGMSNKNWLSIASDETGTNLLACETTIWTYVPTPIPPGPTGATGPTGPYADICFVKDSMVETDQGYVPIQKLIPGKHSLFKQYIIAVTETIHTDSQLVKVSAYAFGSYPTKDTYVSKNHKINGMKTFLEAQEYVNGTTVTLVPYSREPLYNVLCERPSFMKVHGMMAETLHPQSDIALYHKSNRYRRL